MEKQLQKGCVVFMKMRKADIIEFYRRTFETLLPKPLPAQSEEVEKHIVELLETYSKEWVAESGTFKPAPLKRSTFKVAAQAIASLIVPNRNIISEAMDNLALATLRPGDVDISEHVDALCEKLGGVQERQEWISVEDKRIPTDGKEYLTINMNQGGVILIISWNTIHKYYQSKGKYVSHLSSGNAGTHWQPLPPHPTDKSVPQQDAKERYEKIANAEWYKKTYENMSIGETLSTDCYQQSTKERYEKAMEYVDDCTNEMRSIDTTMVARIASGYEPPKPTD